MSEIDFECHCSQCSGIESNYGDEELRISSLDELDTFLCKRCGHFDPIPGTELCVICENDPFQLVTDEDDDPWFDGQVWQEDIDYALDFDDVADFPFWDEDDGA